jgi:hypothetical protein
MRHSAGFGLLLSGTLLLGLASAETQDQLLNSGPPNTSVPLPDPSHLPIVFGKDLKWKEAAIPGESQATLFGDPNKPGIYGVLIKWAPGTNSTPHFHSTDRYAYVVSGTWWASSSSTYDKTKMYPIPAGSLVVDIKNTVHWDGSAAGDKQPCILLLVGEGPVTTTRFVPKAPGSLEYVPGDKK